MPHARTIVLAALLLAPLAAEAYPPPPDDCPLGSEGRGGPEGPRCVPLPCPCTPDAMCVARPLCIATVPRLDFSQNPAKPVPEAEVESVCRADGSCADPNATCQPIRVCVSVLTIAMDFGRGCSVTSRSGGSPWVVPAVLLLALLAGRQPWRRTRR